MVCTMHSQGIFYIPALLIGPLDSLEILQPAPPKSKKNKNRHTYVLRGINLLLLLARRQRITNTRKEAHYDAWVSLLCAS